MSADDAIDPGILDGQLKASLIAFSLAGFLEGGAFGRGQTLGPLFVDLRQDRIDFGVEFLGNRCWVVDSQ